MPGPVHECMLGQESGQTDQCKGQGRNMTQSTLFKSCVVVNNLFAQIKIKCVRAM